jgi:hypothetical protein
MSLKIASLLEVNRIGDANENHPLESVLITTVGSGLPL